MKTEHGLNNEATGHSKEPKTDRSGLNHRVTSRLYPSVPVEPRSHLATRSTRFSTNPTTIIGCQPSTLTFTRDGPNDAAVAHGSSAAENYQFDGASPSVWNSDRLQICYPSMCEGIPIRKFFRERKLIESCVESECSVSLPFVSSQGQHDGQLVESAACAITVLRPWGPPL